MKFDVCVFGGCSLDMVYYQKADGTYNLTADMKVPGGKGSNQAVAAARAGAKTTIISRVAKDDVGKNIIENLNFNGVDTSKIEMVENIDNDYSKIKINLKDKDNEIERFSGAINSFSPDMVDYYAETLLNSKIIVCQLKVPKEVTEKLINFCYENEKHLILTPCRPQRLRISEKNNEDLINKISIITCNKKECETIFETDNVEECVSKYPNKLIVTLGKDGLIYHNGTRIVHMPAIDVEVIDTTGAGDTLNGNLAASLSRGENLQHALRRAMYASSMKIQVKSAQEGMPYAEDLDKFILEYRNKKFNYSDELNFAINLIKDAYERVKACTRYNISTKADNSLVTNIDIGIEKYLISNIRKRYKYDNFLSEETNPNGELTDRTWVIDPIDGTCQFIKNTSNFGIQIAFYDKSKTRFSIIYLPKVNELYYAAENQGAYINNNKILKSSEAPLCQTVVEFGGSLYKEFENKEIYFKKLVKKDKIMVANILHINSCCISFTNLASRKTDALIISSQKPWDVMPGIFLLKELKIPSYSLDFNNKLKLFTSNEKLKNLIMG